MTTAGIIAMKVSFGATVPLKLEHACRRKFATVVPSSCETVGDVKDHLAQTFCLVSKTRLDICVDTEFMLCDEDSVCVIEFYSNKDKTFECSMNPHAFSSSICTCSCTTSTTSSESKPLGRRLIIQDQDRDTTAQSIDEVDSSLTSSGPPLVLQQIQFRVPLATPYLAQKRKSAVAEEMDTDDTGDSPARDILQRAQRAPRKNASAQNFRNDETPDTSSSTGPVTRSAKRRERFRRTVAKQLQYTPMTNGSDKENLVEPLNLEKSPKKTKVDDEDQLGDTDDDTSTLSSADPDPQPVPRRILVPKRRSLSPQPEVASTLMAFEVDVALKSEDETPTSIDYEALPSIEDRNTIQVDDVIAFKVWELGHGGPCLSDYKEARVVDIIGASLILEYLKGGPDTDGVAALEDYWMDDSLGCSTAMDFVRLIRPKRIGPVNAEVQIALTD